MPSFNFFLCVSAPVAAHRTASSRSDELLRKRFFDEYLDTTPVNSLFKMFLPILTTPVTRPRNAIFVTSTPILSRRIKTTY